MIAITQIIINAPSILTKIANLMGNKSSLKVLIAKITMVATIKILIRVPLIPMNIDKNTRINLNTPMVAISNTKTLKPTSKHQTQIMKRQSETTEQNLFYQANY